MNAVSDADIRDVRALLEWGGDISIKNRAGQTALDIALERLKDVRSYIKESAGFNERSQIKEEYLVEIISLLAE